VDHEGELVNFADVLPDHRAGRPEDTILRRDELETVFSLLDAIDEREATVLRLRFGLDGKEPLTLKQIGQEIGLTRERVRQIEVEALAKLNQRLLDEQPSRYFRGTIDAVFEAQRPAPKRPRSRRRARTDASADEAK
jgi:RNA polymerase primary sigma factor